MSSLCVLNLDLYVYTVFHYRSIEGALKCIKDQMSISKCIKSRTNNTCNLPQSKKTTYGNTCRWLKKKTICVNHMRR